MRLFVAIELDELFRNHLIRIQDSFRQSVKASFTKPENLHLTLKFIGEVEDKKLPALCDALQAVRREGAIPLRYLGLDFLPERGPLRIIAAAVDGGEQLLALQKRIEEACATQEIPRENRRFRAHITLARAREGLPRSTSSKLLEQTASLKSAQMMVENFVLMQSRITNEGSQYTPLQNVFI